MAEGIEGVKGAQGAIGADWDMRAKGALGSRGAVGAEEDEGAAVYILLDGSDTTVIGYLALWGFGAKCWTGVEWSGVDGWMDTP